MLSIPLFKGTRKFFSIYHCLQVKVSRVGRAEVSSAPLSGRISDDAFISILRLLLNFIDVSSFEKDQRAQTGHFCCFGALL